MDENPLIHRHASVGGFGLRLTFKQQFATKPVSAVRANNNVGREHFSGAESDGFSGYIDGDDFGIRPVPGSRLVAELIEEFPDIRELGREEPQEISNRRPKRVAHSCEKEVSAGFSHEFINPDMSAEILARLDCFRDSQGTEVMGAIDQQDGDRPEAKPKREEFAFAPSNRVLGFKKKKGCEHSQRLKNVMVDLRQSLRTRSSRPQW